MNIYIMKCKIVSLQFSLQDAWYTLFVAILQTAKQNKKKKKLSEARKLAGICLDLLVPSHEASLMVFVPE